MGEHNTTLRAELAALGELKRALQQEHDQLNAAYEQASGEVTTLQAGRTDLQIQIVKLRNELQSLREDYAELTQAAEQSQADRVVMEEDTLDLTERLSATNLLRRELQTRLSMAEKVGSDLTQKHDLLQKNNSTLQGQLKYLENERDRLMQDKGRVEQDVAKLSEEKQSLTGQLQVMGDKYELTKEEIDYLRAEHADEVASFKKERDLLKEELEALEILKSRFTSLETKYNRLVKPARSKVGRYVVRIQYWKDETGNRYSFKLPGDREHTEVTLTELHRSLTKLKEEYGDKLYTAVWFPDGANLSQDEAWSFTVRINSRYDYYYSNN